MHGNTVGETLRPERLSTAGTLRKPVGKSAVGKERTRSCSGAVRAWRSDLRSSSKKWQVRAIGTNLKLKAVVEGGVRLKSSRKKWL